MTEWSYSYFVVPYKKPDGRVTFAVQECVTNESRHFLLRHLISYHSTHRDAMAAREDAYRERDELVACPRCGCLTDEADLTYSGCLVCQLEANAPE